MCILALMNKVSYVSAKCPLLIFMIVVMVSFIVCRLAIEYTV